MAHEIPRPGAIIVVTAEDDRFAGTRRLAARLARERELPLILYDYDAASLLEAPLPTWWSSDGWETRFPDRLDEQELEAAGRTSIASQVRDLRGSGIDAYGWLPSAHSPQSLASYVHDQRASIVVIPRELAELEGLRTALDAAEPLPNEIDDEGLLTQVVVA
jgi:hypothetical protein